MTTPWAGLRRTGIDVVGDAPWGTHFCQFYHTKQDLIDILVPYFKAGLESNEFCMWITSEPLNAAEAQLALRAAVPTVYDYLARGQLEILPYSEWYLRGGTFHSQAVLDGWVERLVKATAKGYAGLRLSGNTFWLEEANWRDFTNYEEAVNDVIGQYRMMAICTYCLDKCGASEVMDVIKNHQFALIRRESQWDTVESTERRRLGEALVASEERYRALFEHLSEGFAVHEMLYDDNGRPADYRFLEVNPAFEALTGLAHDSVVGHTVREVIPGVEELWIERYGQVASTGRPTHFEAQSETLGKYYEVWAYSPAAGRFATLFVDITERKRAEAEREAFTRAISHDLRQPLTVIQGYVQLLQHPSDGRKLHGREERALATIADNAKRMGAMIRDLLESARLESGQIDLRQQTVDLGTLLPGVVERVTGADDRPRLRLELPQHEPAPVLADPGYLERAVGNLIGNALRYSPPATPVIVELKYGDGKAVVSVTDRGVGIPEQEVPRIFDRYFRATTDQTNEGLGLGLYISRLIVEAHGGRLWVVSQVGQGSTFSFTLPLAKA